MAQTSRFKRRMAGLAGTEPETHPLSFAVPESQSHTPLSNLEPRPATRPLGRSPSENVKHRPPAKTFPLAHKIITIAAVILALVSTALAYVVMTTLPSQRGQIRAQQKVIQTIESEKITLQQEIEQKKETLALATSFTSSLNVDTAPQGAQVYLSGNLLGTTPLHMEGLPGGTHRLRIILEGYDAIEFETALPEKDISDIGLLTLSRSRGTLSLDAFSPDTSYALHDAEGTKVQEGSLPALIDKLPTGEYKLTISWNENQREQAVIVNAHATSTYTVGFETATLAVNSVPSGARVDINGRTYGITPLPPQKIPAGTAHITLHARGYLEAKQEITLQPDASEKLSITLSPQPGPPRGENFTNSLGMEMIWHPAGFWVSRHEVTQQNFQQITNTNPSTFRGRNLPVETLTWNAAVDFTRRLTTHEKENDTLPLGFRYALPTESQWRAFAGNVPRASAGGDIAASTSPVGGEPNVFGLQNIHDNVWEWSSDSADSSPLQRVVLGGGWSAFYSGVDAQRTRTIQPRDMASPAIGMRVVLVSE